MRCSGFTVCNMFMHISCTITYNDQIGCCRKRARRKTKYGGRRLDHFEEIALYRIIKSHLPLLPELSLYILLKRQNLKIISNSILTFHDTVNHSLLTRNCIIHFHNKCPTVLSPNSSSSRNQIRFVLWNVNQIKSLKFHS